MKIEIEIANEPSTYRGIAMIFGVILAMFKPELIAQLTASSMAVSGLIGVFFKDTKE